MPAPGGCRGTPKVAAPTGEARRLEAVMATARVQLDYAQHRAGLETLNPWRNVSTDPPRDAAAHYLRGQLAGGAGDDALAQAELKRAAELSAELGDDRAVAEAWIARISIAADRDVDQEFARSLCDVADVAVTRANDDALLRAGLLQACAGIEFRAANWEEAERLQRRAAERAAAAAGPEHPKVSRALINLGSVLRLRGDFDGAIAQHRRALEIAERSYGPAHPRVAKVEAALGADFGAKGLLPRAREHLQRALAVYHQTLPDDHPNIISVLADLGRVARELGDLDAAEGLAERVVAARRDAGGIRLANALLRRAEVRLERGEIVEAQVDFSEAAELMEALHGPQYAPLSGPLVGLGKCALALNDHAAAVAPLKRALALRGDTKNQSVLASVEFLLAKASWGEGIDRAGAVRLAHAAAARYRTIAPDHAESLAAVQQWLTDHEPLLREH
ncbi:MAG: tetratricopeptide repeat protein [Myxococcota bacterium]